MHFDLRAYPGAMGGVMTIAVVTAVVIALTLLRGEGQFTYALDDAYIHMAVGKHFAEHGVWGATAEEVNSCSSSILWGLLLAGAFWVFGVHDLAPLFINLLICIAFAFYLARQLARWGVPATRCRLLVPAFFLLAPVLNSVFTGMEHIAHTFLSLAFVIETVKLLERGRPTFRAAVPLFLLAPFLTMARYEGLFLIAVVCVLMTFRGGFFPAVLVCVLAVLPLAIFGAAMMASGENFLPNSVTLKAAMEPVLSPWIGWLRIDALINILMAPRILTLMIALGVTLVALRKRRAQFWSAPVLFIVITAAAVVLHGQFANFYIVRYVVYIVTLMLFALAVIDGPLYEKGLRVRREHRIAGWGLLAATLVIGPVSLALIPIGTVNIYQQQRQMAEFFQTYYDGEAVAINDLGTTAYYKGGPLVDLWGLASSEVAEAKMAGEFTPEKIDAICTAKNVKVAIVYDHWFEEYGGLPDHWRQVGRWWIPYNVVCAGPTVSIYAVDPEETPRLIENLRDFSDSLPAPVKEYGAYTRTANDASDAAESDMDDRETPAEPRAPGNS